MRETLERIGIPWVSFYWWHNIMGYCYSLDLRVRVAAFFVAGHSCRAAAQHFDVSENSAIKLVR